MERKGTMKDKEQQATHAREHAANVEPELLTISDGILALTDKNPPFETDSESESNTKRHKIWVEQNEEKHQ